MRTRFLGLLSVISMGVAGAALGCSSDQPNHEANGDSPEAAFGSVGLALEPVPGMKLDSATYVITGPGGFSKTGTINVSHSSSLSVTVPGLPVGAGFSAVLNAVSTDGASSCGGSASFAVLAHATTKVTVKLQCHAPAKSGGVMLNGQLNVCPLIDGIGASPSEVQLGSALLLSAIAHDDDHAPATLGYTWTASAGSLSDTASPSPSFSCTTVGDATIGLTITDGDCTDRLSTTVTCSAPGADPVEVVAATVETTPVPDTGDAADDPAIWVNPVTPALSLVIGTDKQAGGGLGVYGLDGQQLQYVPFGKLNNVDLRDGFMLNGAAIPLVTAGNRSDNSIAIFALDPATRTLSDVAARKITTLATYGSCMYKSPASGKYYYFVDAKDGTIQQWELFENAGKVDAVKVRDLHQLGSQPEACAVDDEAKTFFIGEEAKGVWKFDAEPDVTSGPGWEGVLIASTDPGGHLMRDVEGVAISKTSATAGYIYVSNQGADTYSVFTREAPYSYVKTFRVNRGSACVDAVTGSDGIEANAANLGPAFPHGVFVTQDDFNEGQNQNFKLVPLDHVLGGAPAVDDSACNGGSGGSGGSGGASSGGNAGSGGSVGSGGSAQAGYGEPFCTDFCNKCDSCYATGTFSEGDCVHLVPKTAFTVQDCQAGCALAATPGAAAKASLPVDFVSMTCTAFDDAM